MAARRILVVDDDQAIRSLLSDMLEPAGYTVETAISGRDAIQTLTRRRPDVIVLDLNMPDGNGWVVANYLRALRRPAAIVVVSGMPEAKEWATEIGAAAYLPKPFTIEDLEKAVQVACGSSGHRQPQPVSACRPGA